MNNFPHLLAINESFLDKSIAEVSVSGYRLVSRRDRRDGSHGGILLFAMDAVANSVTLLRHSESDERSWHVVHSDAGPYLLCVWYRRPCAGEVASIRRLETEWVALRDGFLGTIIVGDLNLHHTHWLRFSSHVSVEGTTMYKFCRDNGFKQWVRKPTRINHLLDLFLTDFYEVLGIDVLPRIADHHVVRGRVRLQVSLDAPLVRDVWLYNSANWRGLQDFLWSMDWDFLETLPVDEATVEFTDVLLYAARRFIPQVPLVERADGHPWFNDRCLALVKAKREAEGTARFDDAAAACSAGILEEYHAFIGVTRQKLARARRGSKQWWRLAQDIAGKSRGSKGTPALRDESGNWKLTPLSKANLLADTFNSKCRLPERVENEYSAIAMPRISNGWLSLRSRIVRRLLKELDVESGTGPDGISARFLSTCSLALSLPIAKLARRIVLCRHWPTLWTIHWVVALHKRNSVYDPDMYRGVHMTSQVSKVVERFLSLLFIPRLENRAFGNNQFAYRKRHGARDGVIFYVCSWVLALCRNCKIGIYCSDVSGAFDRVSADRLLRKLAAHGIHSDLLGVIKSWLRNRTAYVVVAGAKSSPFTLADMVFQGAVWGPTLWNTYFGDAACVMQGHGFVIVIYADDYNAFKVYPSCAHNRLIFSELREFQRELHEWGRGNQVQFDAGKESLLIVFHLQPEGEPAKLLGIEFDTKLKMDLAVKNCVDEYSWRLRTLLRTRRFHTDAEWTLLFKSHVLSFVEYRTPAIFHACETVLLPLNRVLRNLLRQLGISLIDSLIAFNLPPLETRRDIAMLGVLHRAVLRQPPQHIWQWAQFDTRDLRRTPRSHRNHTRLLLEVPDSNRIRMGRHSLFGVIKIYNMLPTSIVAESNVRSFQRSLMMMLKDCARSGRPDWPHLYSCRLEWWCHPLRHFPD